MREKVWINRIRIAVGLSLAVGIFVNDRDLTPGWIAFILVLVGLGELASAPGVKNNGENSNGNKKKDQEVPKQDVADEARPDPVPDHGRGNRGRFKSIRFAGQ